MNLNRLDISSFSDSESEARNLPRRISFRRNTRQAFLLDCVTSLAIMLRRLAYYSRLSDIATFFGINTTTIGIAFNFMIGPLHYKYPKGSCYPDVIEFLAVSLNPVAKPVRSSRTLYSHTDKCYGLKYQNIVTPDGITASICGPFVGSIKDQELVDGNDAIEDIYRHLDYRDIDKPLYSIYSNIAYSECDVIIKPYKEDARRNDIEKRANEIMEPLRKAVDWEFDQVATLFSFTRSPQSQKMLLSNCGHQYIIAALMNNIHVCLNRGNKTNDYFGVSPPTLRNYIRSLRSD